LGLSDSEETREIWPQAFELELRVMVGESLETELITRNKGATAFDLSQALHTYFRVGDIGRTEVQGLDGKSYIDKLDNGARKKQQGAVCIDGETDRIYTGLNGDLEIRDQALGRSIRIATSGSASAVVWNPWAATAASMGDMICVETANAGPDVVRVTGGGEHRLSARYDVSVL
jgi:glucose-6-phosphate 1-epimerase